ncbi:MAG: NAD(P)-dependent oxidoreductase, partial [Pseudomonadota bacterium]
IGRAVTEALADQGVPLRLVLRSGTDTSRLPPGAAGAQRITTPDLFAEPADWWAETCKGASMVMHLAWHVDPADYLISEKNLTCLAGTLEIARGAVAAGVGRIVGAGTCFEYRLTQEDLAPGTTPLEPLTPYAAAKIAAFQCLQQWLAHSQTTFMWGRFFYLYGAGEPPARLVPFLHAKLVRGEEVPLSSGNQIRDFMDVDAAAALMVRAALSQTTGPVNICSGRGITVRTLAEQIADGYGRRDLLRFGARPDKLVDPPRIVGAKTPIVLG